MPLDGTAVLTALRDHAGRLAIFEHVEGAALVNPPHTGIAVAFEFGSLGPVPQHSGLAVTSALVVWTASVYKTLESQPTSDVELDILGAASALINAYSGDFDLGGTISFVDLLGQTGQRLSAEGGYINIDGTQFRTVIVTIPTVVENVWDQVS